MTNKPQNEVIEGLAEAIEPIMRKSMPIYDWDENEIAQAAYDYMHKHAPCPYVETSDEGTSFCKLAENSVPKHVVAELVEGCL